MPSELKRRMTQLTLFYLTERHRVKLLDSAMERSTNPPRRCNVTGDCGVQRCVRPTVLLIVENRSRPSFAQFKMVGHFLEARSESLNLLLLRGYSRFLFCSSRL